MRPVTWFVVLLFCFVSCKTYRMLDGTSKPVYITPDASVFDDSTLHEQTISYQDLLNLRGNEPNLILLRKNEVSKAIINRPTFFNLYDDYLIYPREHILITKGNYNEFTVTKIHGSRKRNRELAFFAILSRNLFYPELNRTPLPLDSVLRREIKLKENTPVFAARNQHIFDSLIKKNRVHKKFEKLAQGYIDKRKYIGLFDLYKQNKDTLQAYGLYKQKCEQLAPFFIGNNKPQHTTSNLVYFNELSYAALPYPVNRVRDANQFKACFDSIEGKFRGPARDYLLSQLMYSSCKYNIAFDTLYETKYAEICMDKDYRNLIKKVWEQEKAGGGSVADEDSSLMSLDGKTKLKFSTAIDNYKGKVVLIDFWATWCMPCRREKPYLDSLSHLYSDDKMAIISVSVENETQPWQKFVFSSGTPDLDKNFLLIDPETSALVKHYGIDEIPRYMIIGKDGKIINADAPHPDDPELKKELTRLLTE